MKKRPGRTNANFSFRGRKSASTGNLTESLCKILTSVNGSHSTEVSYNTSQKCVAGVQDVVAL